MRYRCLSCGGEYDADQPSGYFHACPPGTKDARDENITQAEPSERDPYAPRLVKRKREGKGRVPLPT